MEIIHDIKDHYRSGSSDIGKDFFIPCLRRCIRYRRAVAFFSSSALVTWSEALSNLIEKSGVTVSLLIAPVLSNEDLEALKSALAQTERERLRSQIADEFIVEALDQLPNDELTKWRLNLFSWMVANDRLLLRFAFPKHVEKASIFHEKIGIFDFSDGWQIGFTGSANETFSGYHRNYESIDVYRSWVRADASRVQAKVEQFEEAWHKKAIGLDIRDLSQETLERVRSSAPRNRPAPVPPSNRTPATPRFVKTNRWRHQDEAVDVFLAKRRGILEMATGTGKTRTAMKVLERLLSSGAVHGAIVSTDGTDLLDQWRATLDEWVLDTKNRVRILRHYSTHHEITQFARSPENAVLVVSRQQLKKLFQRLSPEKRKRLFIIHDEVHGLGGRSFVRDLQGEHASFDYVLGLTATPEREYDDEGNAFIEQEIGTVIFEFGLDKAIARGILCEFDYVPLEYDLSADDRLRLQNVFKRKSVMEAEGLPMSDEELFMALSMVYKTAEGKPSAFQDYLRQNPEVLKSTILFVATREYGEQFLTQIHPYTYNYRTYYGEDDRKNLLEFAQGNIDCLITCHRISQGIDVPGLNNIILVSSDRAKLETIQRIGRSLRVDPNNPDKQAKVVDFICVKERAPNKVRLAADEQRMTWLSSLAEVRREEE